MMFILDLRIVIAMFAALLMLAAAAGAWWQRRRDRARSRQRDALAWDHAPVGMMRVRKDGTLEDVNALARAWLQLPDDAQRLPQDVGWDDALREDIDQALSQSQTRHRTIAMPDGRTLHWRILPQREEAWVFLQDVSLAAQRGRLVDFLLKELSHELRTPLSIILTNLNLLKEGRLPEDAAHRALNMAETEARRLRALISDMFDLGQLETRERLILRPVDLAALVSEIIAEQTTLFQAHGQTLTLVADDHLPLVMADATWLQRAIHNLLDNARKFCGPGDEVQVRLSQTEAGVRLEVCDTGPGIPPDHLPLVTQRFYRIQPEGSPGSGLGLALVAEILRHHHSQLQLQSPRPGMERGLCASFILAPVREDAP